MRTLSKIALALLVSLQLFAQQTGSIEGQVTDTSGAVIPGAAVAINGPGGVARTVTTNETGAFSVVGLAPGSYTVRVTTTGFAPVERKMDVTAGRATRLDAALQVALETQKVTVQEESRTTVSTDPSNNAGAIVLKGSDLDALSDDPDELAQDLQALAGPAAGPNGGQIYIDGFSGAQLPPKAAIREVRINQNPFSAEYDRLGFGRIEIFTKPGADKLRGQVMYGFSDRVLNSRNPFVANPGNFRSQLFNFNIGGPLSKRASYFIDAERRNIDENEIVNATILNPDLSLGFFRNPILTPQRRTSVSPRFDYALSDRHTLVARYHYNQNENQNSGIGQFTLPERAVNADSTGHTVQLTETSVLSPTAINETRLQWMRSTSERSPVTPNAVAINVLEAFNAGGAPVGLANSRNTRWELQNVTSLTHGAHGIKFGGRFRRTGVHDISPNNFFGTYTFGSGFGPALDANNQPIGTELQPLSSLERYRRTLLFQTLNYTPQQIRALGGEPTQFAISGGTPLATIDQMDVGLFIQDDWKIRRNFTLSAGLRYENQTNISSNMNWAPRIGFAFAPGARRNRAAKTVIRGGVGVFYDRVEDDLTLEALRFNGVTQQRFIVQNPDFYPSIPSAAELTANAVPQTIRRLDPTLQAPYLIQSAIGVERQLPRNTTIAVTYTDSRGRHLLRSRALPLPAGTVPGSDASPLGYFYESTGVLNQKQMIVNFNSRFSRRVSIFSFYVLNKAMSDTDGAGTFPANELNLRQEYGRASNDRRHMGMIGGALTAPFGIRLNPFIIIRSGMPFNITTGRDTNGDTLFTDRPTFAQSSDANIRATQWGTFNLRPLPGEVMIPRNYGEGPGMFTVNMRLSKTFGFGERQGTSAAAGNDQGGGMGGPRGGGGGGPRGGGGGGPRGGGGGMRMGGGGGGMFGEGGTNSRYNLTLSVSARNLLNTVNLDNPVGNLGSALFGQSTGLAGGFGPGGNPSNNRRIELQLRFSF